MVSRLRHVRSSPQSRHSSARVACPLSASSGHGAYRVGTAASAFTSGCLQTNCDGLIQVKAAQRRPLHQILIDFLKIYFGKPHAQASQSAIGHHDFDGFATRVRVRHSRSGGQRRGGSSSKRRSARKFNAHPVGRKCGRTRAIGSNKIRQ